MELHISITDSGCQKNTKPQIILKPFVSSCLLYTKRTHIQMNSLTYWEIFKTLFIITGSFNVIIYSLYSVLNTYFPQTKLVWGKICPKKVLNITLKKSYFHHPINCKSKSTLGLECLRGSATNFFLLNFCWTINIEHVCKIILNREFLPSNS